MACELRFGLGWDLQVDAVDKTPHLRGNAGSIDGVIIRYMELAR